MRILATAQDFGLGPLAMLDCIASQLTQQFEVCFWLPKHLTDRLSASCNRFGTFLPYRTGRILPDLKGFDGMVVACDYELVDHIGSVIPSAVILDMLFWFWARTPVPSHDNCLIIAQNFFGVQERADGSSNTVVVSPFQLVNSTDCTRRKGTLVNLGGFSSPYHSLEMASNYIQLILPSLMGLTRVDKDVVITGGDLILTVLNGELPGRFELRALRHDEMQQTLSSYCRFVTVPGIGSIYESVSAEIPTYFLPPTNLTQLLQSNLLRTHLHYPHLYLPFTDLTDCLDYNELSEDMFITSLFDLYRSQSARLGNQLDECVKRFITDVQIAPWLFDRFCKQLWDHLVIDSGPTPVDRTIEHLIGDRDLY